MNITYICCIHIAMILKGALKLTDPLCVSKIKSKTPSTVHKHTYFTRFLVYSSTCWILSLLSGMKITASPESRSVSHYSVTHTHTHTNTHTHTHIVSHSDAGCPEALEIWTGPLPLVSPLFVYVVFPVHQGGRGECFPQLLVRCMFMSARVFDVMCWARSCFFAIDVNKNVCIWLYNTDQCTLFF